MNAEARLAFAAGDVTGGVAAGRTLARIATSLYGVAKYQLIASQRQLTRAALALRRLGLVAGGYPPQPPELPALRRPDPFTGRPITYRRRADGSLSLALAGARELAREVLSATRPLGPFFEVLLPARRRGSDDEGSGRAGRGAAVRPARGTGFKGPFAIADRGRTAVRPYDDRRGRRRRRRPSPAHVRAPRRR